MTQLEFSYAETEELRPPKYRKVDFESFNLLYSHKEDGVVYLGKMVTNDDYVLINSVTGEVSSITRYKLRKSFKSNKKVNKANKKIKRLFISGRRSAS